MGGLCDFPLLADRGRRHVSQHGRHRGLHGDSGRPVRRRGDSLRRRSGRLLHRRPVLRPSATRIRHVGHGGHDPRTGRHAVDGLWTTPSAPTAPSRRSVPTTPSRHTTPPRRRSLSGWIHLGGYNEWQVDATDGRWTFAEVFRRWVTVCEIPAANVELGDYIIQIQTTRPAERRTGSPSEPGPADPSDAKRHPRPGPDALLARPAPHLHQPQLCVRPVLPGASAARVGWTACLN